MNKSELEQLAEYGFVTDITLFDELEKNPELLNTIELSEFVKQVISPIDAAEAEQKLIEMISTGKAILSESVKMSMPLSIAATHASIDLNNNNIDAPLFSESNGEIIEGGTDSYAFWVKEGGELVIDGEGLVKTQPCKYSMAVWADGGNVTINGGTYENAGEGSDLIYASNGGNVTINGGTFKPCEKQSGVDGTKNTHSALNIKDKDYQSGASSIIVKGGKFYNFNPANNLSEGPNTNFVAEGYESVEVEPNVWEVRKV